MTAPLPSATPLAASPLVDHWACLEIDHTDHPLISLCGEPMELDRVTDLLRQPEHLCTICQLLAPHHGTNCSSCAVYVRRWGLAGPL